MLAKERSPNRDKAFEMYKDSKGKMLLKDIAAALDIKEGTIRAWKNRDKWDESIGVTLQKKNNNATKKECNVTNKKNETKQTKSNKKKTNSRLKKEAYPQLARPGNKNAVRTGEYEKIMFDTMDETELQLIKTIEENKKDLLIKEIQLLTVRERRMLKRIKDLSEKEMEVVREIERGEDETEIESENTLLQIQNIEEALSRVQEKKLKAIDSLHKYEIDESKFELELMKFEVAALKDIGPGEETEDDGFIDALKGEVSEVWDDAE